MDGGYERDGFTSLVVERLPGDENDVPIRRLVDWVDDDRRVGRRRRREALDLGRRCSDDDQRQADGRAYRKYIAGTTTMFRSVEVVKPQRITIAIGV